METDGLPSWDEWDALHLIASNVDYIVDDAAAYPGQGRGLFAMVAPAGPLPADGSRSRLEADIGGSHAADFGASWMASPYLQFASAAQFKSAAERIVEVMPGAVSLGTSRAARLVSLRERLRDQPAYAWLLAQVPYKAILGTLENSRGPISDTYRSDVAEFRVLAPIARALMSFHSTVRYGGAEFPTPGELAQAVDQGKALLKFLQRKNGLYATDRFPVVHIGTLQGIVRDLERAGDSFQRKRDPDKELPRHAVQTVAVELHRTLGDTSITVLAHFAALVGAPQDAGNLRKLVSEALAQRGLEKTHDKQGRSLAKMEPAPALASAGVWNLAQLMASGKRSKVAE